MPDRPHILIVGGGYVGMYTALRLQKKLRRNEARITVVDPQNYMTYQPFLPETAAGSLEPRHVVVPLRKVLRRCKVVTGMVTRRRPRPQDRDRAAGRGTRGRRSRTTRSWSRPARSCGRCRSRAWPRAAIGFKTVGEAIYLRNHVLSRLDYAASVTGRGAPARGR